VAVEDQEMVLSIREDQEAQAAAEHQPVVLMVPVVPQVLQGKVMPVETE
jgi:hypothetical protein